MPAMSNNLVNQPFSLKAVVTLQVHLQYNYHANIMGVACLACTRNCASLQRGDCLESPLQETEIVISSNGLKCMNYMWHASINNDFRQYHAFLTLITVGVKKTDTKPRCIIVDAEL